MDTPTTIRRPKQVPLAAGSESPAVRRTLIGLALAVVAMLLILPVSAILIEAFSQGISVYFSALTHPHTWSAIRATLLVCSIAVPLNCVFGVLAAWCIAKFDFPGKSVLVACIDLPLSVSPVIAGLLFVLLFGARGVFGPFLTEHHIRIIFAIPGMVIATVFVTLPFVARELAPLMEAQGSDDELAGLSLGASGWQTFWRVTLPNVKWGLLYGIVLCTARALGEFGAVSVVSGLIRGETNTIPLHVQSLYDDSHFAAAFAVASLLTVFAVITLVVKTIVEHKTAAALDGALAGRGRPWGGRA
jgi:sulfate transport system permease protein